MALRLGALPPCQRIYSPSISFIDKGWKYGCLICIYGLRRPDPLSPFDFAGPMRCWQPLSLLILCFSVSYNNTAQAASLPDITNITPYNFNTISEHHTPASLPSPSPISANPYSLTARSDGYQAFLHLGDGWNLYYSSWASMSLPVQPAVWALNRLYTNMARDGGSIWRLSPPLHTIPLKVGNIYLWMNCQEEPIPWDLVQLFGEKMLGFTRRGWTGLYELSLSNAARDVTISVILRIVNQQIRGEH